MAGQGTAGYGGCAGEEKKITASVFVTVFDIRHDMAAVRSLGQELRTGKRLW